MSSSSGLPSVLLYEGAVYLTGTTFVVGVTWGLMTALYAVCMQSLVRNLRSPKPSRKNAMLTAWITILWISSSLSSIANVYCTLYAFTWEWNYPGGPLQYLAGQWNQPVPQLAYISYLLAMWFADGLMLWRLVVFYAGDHYILRNTIYCFMFLIYIGVIGTGCFTIVINSSNETLYSQLARKAALPCFTLSVTLNVFAAIFISARLLWCKRQMEKTTGYEEAENSPYTSVAAMIIESSSLYAVCSLVWIITYALNSLGQYIMLMVLGNVQVIAPTLIVYRVARGMAWDEKTSARLTSTQIMFYEGQGRSDTMIMTHNSENQNSVDTSKMVFSSSSQAEVKVIV